ncbi:hypothetical protein Ddye_023221 [Dipteronia dyeriana]|uniref:Uncharacterized protein n=1 Tax=Dipteronia dyeriana TaxID=168575 RepID=A0AAD9TT70_9ROSI|nr:hypothetical protein Ddye_023221 [Dipteronia dyeriana]
MSCTNLLHFLSLLLVISMINFTTGQECYESAGNFTTNSTYGRNRDLIFSSIASNVTANGGFYNVSMGQDPDRVYALALCRGDINSSLESDCASCISSGIRDIMSKCPNQKEALSWGSNGTTPCIVRYASSSIFEKRELDPLSAGFNTGDIKTSNLTEFDEIWENLMVRIVTKTSHGSSRLKFGTGEADVTLFQKIYALMQCTPDLSQQDCEYCLSQSLSYFQTCCHGKQGGFVLRPSCFLRWDLYPFYTSIADDDVPSPPPSSSQLPNTTTSPPPSPFRTSSEDKGRISSGTVTIIVASPVVLLILVIIFSYVCLRRKNSKKKKKNTYADGNDNTVESLQFDFNTIIVATNNFSIDNMLGEGGFGVVYKGRLPDGQDVAVKRLSNNSGQGEVEFKNEVLLVARLQHRNLVRLLGFCLEGNERLLIYEFVANSSLDKFIFDPIKRLLLNWDIRYKIIGGIARGILYLHEDSRLRIIHRDLKASNILLDQDMNSKISDFGMARLFEIDQTHAQTSRVVGTFGYMAPEYILRGNFSIKSDVFSFGVLVLEIISGQKNNTFRNGNETGDLLTYAWESWSEGTALNLIDPILRADCSTSEIMRCIHIGLLCVQENVSNRPKMASVVLMLTSCSISLQIPTKPAFFMHTTTDLDNRESTSSSNRSKSRSVECSVNEASISELDPR